VETTTAQIEKLLGEGDVLEPTADELRAMEAPRKETLPELTIVQPAYAGIEGDFHELDKMLSDSDDY
jgi:hypothetical protein